MSSELRFLREIRMRSGSPASLRVYDTGRYSKIWDSHDTKADQKCTVWRPSLDDKSFFFLGDHAQGDLGYAATGVSELVKPMNDDPNNPLLKFPDSTDWVRMWSKQLPDKSKSFVSIWSPIPPSGYVPLGWVGWKSLYEYEPPTFSENDLRFVCVHREFAKETDIGVSIWNDKGSKAKQDITLYSAKGVPNGFVGQANYLPYSGTVFKLSES